MYGQHHRCWNTSTCVPSRTIADQVKAFDKYAMNDRHTRSSESLTGCRVRKDSASFDSEKKSGHLLPYKSVSDQDSNIKENSPTAPVSPKVKVLTKSEETTILHNNKGSIEGESKITHSDNTDNTCGPSDTSISLYNVTNTQLPTSNGKKDNTLCHGFVGSKSDLFRKGSSKTSRDEDIQEQTSTSNSNTVTQTGNNELKDTHIVRNSKMNARKLSERRRTSSRSSSADISSNQNPTYEPPGKRISIAGTPSVDENFPSNLVNASELSRSDTHVRNKGLGSNEELHGSLSHPDGFEMGINAGGLANKLAKSCGTLSHLSDYSSQANERKHIIESTHELLEDYIRDSSVCNDELEPVVLGRFKNAKEILDKTGMVIIMCAEKDGATHLGYNLMTAYEETRKCIVGNASEFLTCISGGDEPYTVLYDNAFGMTKFDGQEVDNWETHIERSSMKRTKGSMKLILILKYKNALDCQQFLNRYEASMLDLSDKTNQLNDEEKLFVLKRCINRMNSQCRKTRIVLDKETLEDIASTAVSFGFFGMVEQFLSRNIDMGADFFRKPSIDLYRQIDSLKNSNDERDKNKYLALASVHLSAKRISKEDIAMLCKQSILDLTFSRSSVKSKNDLLGCSPGSRKGSKSVVESQNQSEMYKFLMEIASSIKCSTNLGKRVSDGIKLLESKFLRKLQNSHTFSSPSIETAIAISVGQNFPEITVKFCNNDFLHEYVGTDMSFSPDEARCIRIDLTKKELCLTLFERLKKSLDSLDFKYFASHPLVRDARFVQVLQENWHEQQALFARLRNKRKTFLDVAISARNSASGESLLISSLDYPFYEQSSVDSRSLADWVIRHKKWKDFRKENTVTATELERLVTERCCRENWEEAYMSIVEYVKISSACLFEAIKSGSLNITKDILSISRFSEEDYERALDDALNCYTRDMIQVRRNVLEEVVKYTKVTSLLTSLAKSGNEKSLGVLLQVLKHDVNKVCTAQGPIVFLLIEYNIGYLVEEVLRNFSFDLYAEFQGQLCSHRAAELGRLKILQLFHEVDQTLLVKRNQWGKTPLHLSSSYGHIQCVKYLLQQDVDVNVRDTGGQTPLHCAAYLANAEVAHLLLENGADLYIEDNRGETARDIARRCKHDRVEKTLYRRISHPCDGALAAIRRLYEY